MLRPVSWASRTTISTGPSAAGGLDRGVHFLGHEPAEEAVVKAADGYIVPVDDPRDALHVDRDEDLQRLGPLAGRGEGRGGKQDDGGDGGFFHGRPSSNELILSKKGRRPLAFQIPRSGLTAVSPWAKMSPGGTSQDTSRRSP